MIKSVEQVCEQLPHFGTIQQEGKDIEIWAKPFIPSKSENGYHTAGIYCIENYLTNKIYIGMSRDIATRIGVHKRELDPTNSIMHHNKLMYKDSVNYGLHNFSFGIIETFEDADHKFLLKREEEWIQFYEKQSSNCIYNMTRCKKYDEFEIIPDTTYMKNKIELSPNREEIINLLTEGYSTRFVEDYISREYGENISHTTLARYRRDNLSYKEMPSDNPKEQFPIDYLISDVLQIKVEAHNIQNEKLYQYADYLEKRLMQFKKGEIEFVKDIQGD